jgi:hypothetical protein
MERITFRKPRDVSRFEKPERELYPKELDAGRIVAEEISDKQPEKYMKYPRKPKSTKATVTRKHVTERFKPHEKDVNVGKLDLYQLETREVESRKTEHTSWKKPEWVERPGKACLNIFMDHFFETTNQDNSVYYISEVAHIITT